MFYYKPPGSRGQGLHQDNNPLAVDPGTCIAAWIALDPCDAENGALSVVPGTGPLELLCDAEMDERSDLFFNGGSLHLPEGVTPKTVDMEPGDVLFFNGQLIHGSFPNTTEDRWRRTLIFHYVPESCEEVSGFYFPLLDTQGNEVTRRASPAGGPCGKFQVSMTMMG
jgi:ectoine hydroxylase-related dioxygenase (phytanoyl-CoA dioxygenase family)